MENSENFFRSVTMKSLRIVLLIAISLSACSRTGSPTETSEPTEADSPTTEVSPESLPATTEEPQVIYGLGYRPDAFFENQVDLYLPESAEQVFHPAVLVLHGGGDDKHDMEELALQLVEAGYAAAAANFRSMGGGEYPGTVEDVFCALAWMVDSAEEFNLDPDRIYAVGFSMGGTLAAMLAVVDTPEIYLSDCPASFPSGFQLRSAVVYTGIFDYVSAASYHQALGAYIEGYLGGTSEDQPQVWEQASAINWVDGSEPPILLLHGGADEDVDPQQTHDFETQLLLAGAPVEKLIFPGVDHYGLIVDPSALDAMFNFLAD
jgi:acetyl esterase/lipase